MTGLPVSADFVDFRTYQTRSVIRLFFEAPIEDAMEIIKRLGGVPTAAKSQACAIVLLNPDLMEAKAARAEEAELVEPAADKTAWRKLSFVKQAGILCKDPEFQGWLKVDGEEAAAEQVRRICGCRESRRELDRNSDAAAIWVRLSDAFRSRRDRASQEKSLNRR